MRKDSRDVVQNSFESLENREEVDHATSKSYLFTIAYNQMIDHIRKKQTDQPERGFFGFWSGVPGQRPNAKRIP